MTTLNAFEEVVFPETSLLFDHKTKDKNIRTLIDMYVEAVWFVLNANLPVMHPTIYQAFRELGYFADADRTDAPAVKLQGVVWYEENEIMVEPYGA